jgi:hypothetical protein
MSGAGLALHAGVIAAVQAIEGLHGVYPGAPIQAAVPFATVETGPETDWGHKSGTGRELRVAVTLRDGGEAPTRVQALAVAVEGAVGEIGPEQAGWRLVSLVFLRSRLVQDRSGGWAAMIEWRARMLAF